MPKIVLTYKVSGDADSCVCPKIWIHHIYVILCFTEADFFFFICIYIMVFCIHAFLGEVQCIHDIKVPGTNFELRELR